jgi:NAD(P)-dependent dehydrogenase (short-subunit alcohol dehydrogenase family)
MGPLESSWQMIARGAGRALGALVDPTIVLSFDRTGYRIHSLAFDPGDLEVDLSGRVALVTGANSGIGFATALGLARLGAEVWLLCRNAERGAAAAEAIRRQTGSDRVQVGPLDVAERRSVREFAGRFVRERVDVLVHNAGVLPVERGQTSDGLERVLATHVVGPHLLTEVLLPRLRVSGDARVIWVSSGGMYTQRLRLDDPQWRERPWDGVTAYAQTKRMQVVLAELWAQRLLGSGVAVYAMHPGWADTPAVQSSLPRFWRVMRPLLRTPEEGADTVVWLAASKRIPAPSGSFWFDREPRRTHYLPFTAETAADRDRLWMLCEDWARG